jgi:hypothetical protein
MYEDFSLDEFILESESGMDIIAQVDVDIDDNYEEEAGEEIEIFELTNEELEKVHNIFGNELEASFGRTANGEYFVYGNSGRGNLYENIEDIPIEEYEEIVAADLEEDMEETDEMEIDNLMQMKDEDNDLTEEESEEFFEEDEDEEEEEDEDTEDFSDEFSEEEDIEDFSDEFSEEEDIDEVSDDDDEDYYEEY